jgi:hypothetical protein
MDGRVREGNPHFLPDASITRQMSAGPERRAAIKLEKAFLDPGNTP